MKRASGMYKVNNPCLDDITGIVRTLYNRGIITLGEMKSLFVQINNVAWRLYGSENYTGYIERALQTAAICEDLEEFKRKGL